MNFVNTLTHHHKNTQYYSVNMFTNFILGDTTDHIIISLRNGGVFVRVNLGSGPYEGHLQNNGYKFDDNQWHHLVVNRISREVIHF